MPKGSTTFFFTSNHNYRLHSNFSKGKIQLPRFSRPIVATMVTNNATKPKPDWL